MWQVRSLWFSVAHEINHMYDIAFAKLWRVIRGSLADSAETEEQVYREIRLVEARVLEAIDGAQA